MKRLIISLAVLFLAAGCSKEVAVQNQSPSPTANVSDNTALLDSSQNPNSNLPQTSTQAKPGTVPEESSKVTLLALQDSNAKARDYQRLVKIKVDQELLEEYYNTNSSYPATFADKAPAPADLPCSATDNDFKYATSNDSYSLTFCISSPVNGYSAGLLSAGPAGISQLKSLSKETTTIYDSEVIALQNKTTADLQPYIEKFKSKNADLTRVYDISLIKSALGLYYIDYNYFPSSLNSLAPSYLGTVPSAPYPPAQGCSVENNTYTYKIKQNKSGYDLSYCIGQQTEGYSPGVHKISIN
ncbi:MAG: hypothetical protein JWO40_267 [Candidatus Doudnabacteria bacterium]|nr:hypothetical protein [Candidatus Doudnabacteria bacterium]